MRMIKRQLNDQYSLPVKFNINHIIVSKGLVLLGQGINPKIDINTVINPIKNSFNILYKNLDMNYVAINMKCQEELRVDNDNDLYDIIDIIITFEDYSYVFECVNFSISDEDTLIGFHSKNEYELLVDLLDIAGETYEQSEFAYGFLVSIPNYSEIELHFHIEKDTAYEYKYVEEENEDNKNLN